MFIEELPLTRGRLASSVELQVMIPVKINLGIGVVFEWKPGMTLATISKLTRTQTREVYRRYFLGTFAFEPFDIIPGKITTNLRLEKIVLYSEYVLELGGTTLHLSDGDILGALGYVSGSLFFQQRPFAIQEIIHPPSGVPESIFRGPTVTTYYDCWFTENPIEYDIFDRDQLIIQECNVAVGKVTTSIPFEKATVPFIRKMLPNEIKIG